MKNLKSIITISATLALNTNAAYVMSGSDTGTITDTNTGSVIADYSITAAGSDSGITYTDSGSDGVRVNTVYSGLESIDYTVNITNVAANYALTNVFYDSGNVGNFSIGAGQIGFSIDQDATFVSTNAAYKDFIWSNANANWSMDAQTLNGIQRGPGVLYTTTDYINQTGEQGIWGLNAGDATTQVFNYSTLTDVGVASESFFITVDFVPEPSSTALLGLGGLALLARRKR